MSTPVLDEPSIPRRLPEQIEGEGLLVAWSLADAQRRLPIGFRSTTALPSRSTELDPILFEGDGHLMTVAPTGAGKGTGCIIPTLLRYPGPVIVVDPKGENLAVTARYRRALGQRVIVLDPLGITDGETDRLDPVDLVDAEGRNALDDIAALTELMAEPRALRATDRFWIQRGMQLVNGLILYLLRSGAERSGILTQARRLVSTDPREFKTLAERMRAIGDPDLDAVAASLTLPAESTLGGYLSFAQDALDWLRGESVQAATRDSTFSLDDVTRGEALSIFIVIPPAKLESHARLLRLWIGVLMGAITRRRRAPAQETLFLLDEAPQLGQLPQLRQAITLLRGYGLRTWSFWQDLSQLRLLYPDDWQTMVNNCRVFQSFGVPNLGAAEALCSLTGYSRPEELLDLDVDEMLLLISGDAAEIARRPNYRADPVFRGRFDRNPLHDDSREIMPASLRPQRRVRPAKPQRARQVAAPVIDGERVDRIIAWLERESA